MTRHSAGAEAVRESLRTAEDVRAEPPRPLVREFARCRPLPLIWIGKILEGAACAIHNRVQAPVAMCAQSVLAVASLATQGHADVELPTGRTKPLSSYYVSIGVTGERKSAVDTEALRPVRKREAMLRGRRDVEDISYANARAAWDKAREYAMRRGKGNCADIKAALDALRAAPS